MKLNHIVEKKEEQLSFTEKLNEHKFLELLREKARNSYLVVKTVPLYLDDKGEDMMLVRPDHKEQKSAFWIDKLIQTFSNWNRYPSRRHCLKVYPHLDRV